MSEIDTSKKPQRYYVPSGGGIAPNPCGIIYLREEADAMINAIASERDAAVARAEQAENARPAWLANCCICGRVVDTREVSEGGDQHGCQYDGGWVCSSDCGCRLLGDPTEAEEHAAHEAEALAQGMRKAAKLCLNDEFRGSPGHGPGYWAYKVIMSEVEKIEKGLNNEQQ